MSKLKLYYEKFNILKTPDFKCTTCPLKNNLKNCKSCTNAFYRLNLLVNKNKINQTKLLSDLKDKNIDCGVGSCPEIYREKIFTKLNAIPKKRLNKAKELSEINIMFRINPYKTLARVKYEIKLIQNILNKYL